MLSFKVQFSFPEIDKLKGKEQAFLSLSYFNHIILLHRFEEFCFAFTFHHLHFHWMLFWKHLFSLLVDYSLASHLNQHSERKKIKYMLLLIQSNILILHTSKNIPSVSWNFLFKICMWKAKLYQARELTSLRIFNGLFKLIYCDSIYSTGRSLTGASLPDFHQDRK